MSQAMETHEVRRKKYLVEVDLSDFLGMGRSLRSAASDGDRPAKRMRRTTC
ncbi:uncharacterized protein G2W53_018571 [Senna tora]|uniref:Uncharacterized protein n=1 Tax=Senna tora TaxID=362788 RepID=A0A834WLG1_9FABA|nr:uncharacterized protein G2W53_018571 [Senna tora]